MGITVIVLDHTETVYIAKYTYNLMYMYNQSFT